MTSAEIRLHLSDLAHSLASRHREASYFRPQYYLALCEALDTHQRADLKGLVLIELIDAVGAQCGSAVGAEHEELLFAAFGAERLDPRADLTLRSSAHKAFGRLVGVAGLPERVIEKARSLYDGPPPFGPRVLPLPYLNLEAALRRNPLSPWDSLVALANWKLGNPSPLVPIWQGWLTNMVSWQVRFRFTLGVPASIGYDDIFGDSLLWVLERLAVYQPGPRVTLERWVFGVANQAAGMAIRKQRRVIDAEAATDAVEELLPPAKSAEDAASSAGAELVEYAMTRPRDKGVPPDIGARVEVFLDSLGALLGGNAPRDEDELTAQLRGFFPGIREDQIGRIAAHSHIGQTSKEVC